MLFIREEKAMMQSKEDYIEKLTAMLNEMSTKIDELKVQANLGKTEVRNELEKQIKMLKEQQSLVNKKLEEVRGAGEEAWEEVKFGIESAIHDLKDGLKKALDKLK